jgi:acylphosphatase
MERLEAVVSGKVQGVFFRDHAVRAAESLGLTGEVKNLPDGTVHAIAEGIREQLEQYVDELRKGSPASNVETVSIEWHPASGEYASFSITRISW